MDRELHTHTHTHTHKHTHTHIYIYMYSGVTIKTCFKCEADVSSRQYAMLWKPSSKSVTTDFHKMYSNLKDIYFLVFQLSLLVTLSFQNFNPLQHGVHAVTSSKYSATKLALFKWFIPVVCDYNIKISKWYQVGESKHNTLLRCKVSKVRQHVSAFSIRPSSGLTWWTKEENYNVTEYIYRVSQEERT